MIHTNSTKTISSIETSPNKNISDEPYAIMAEGLAYADNSAKETISLIGVFPNHNIPKSTSDKDKHVVLDDEEAWKKFFALQNNPSTNITNKRKPKPYVHKDSDGIYKYTTQGENKYKGKDIRGKIAEQIKREISESAKNNTIKFIRLKEAKFASMNENGIVEPSVRIMLNGNSKEINMVDILGGDTCKRCRVRAVTLLLPTDDQSEKRGIRYRIDNNGRRIYEVANGSYEMTLKWFVEGKECKIRILISDDGSIKLIEGNGVTEEQLHAHQEVKVGKQYELKFLHEALASQLPQTQLQQSSEAVKVLPQPSQVQQM